jgi:hypothetical protein
VWEWSTLSESHNLTRKIWVPWTWPAYIYVMVFAAEEFGGYRKWKHWVSDWLDHNQLFRNMIVLSQLTTKRACGHLTWKVVIYWKMVTFEPDCACFFLTDNIEILTEEITRYDFNSVYITINQNKPILVRLYQFSCLSVCVCIYIYIYIYIATIFTSHISKLTTSVY